MGSRAPVGDLSPLAEPLPPAWRKPPREAMGTLPGSRSANPASPGEGAGVGGRPLPNWSALQSAKAPWSRGDPPAAASPSLGRSGEVGCARPQPDSAGNLGSWRAPGGDAAESGPGRRGRGQAAGGDGWGVCFESPSPGRGREAAVSAATSERAKQLSNFACAAPLPRAAGRAGGCAVPGAPATGPAGSRSGCRRAGRGPGPGCRSGPAAPGVRLGSAARSRRRARPPPPPPGPSRPPPDCAPGRGRRMAAEPWKLPGG